MEAVSQADGFGVEQQNMGPVDVQDGAIRGEFEVLLSDLQRWVDLCRAQNERAPLFIVRQRLGSVPTALRRQIVRDLGYMNDRARENA